MGIPFEAPILHAMGVSFPLRVRTVIRLHTDDGLVGVGECGPSPLVRFTERGLMQDEVAPRVIGANPFDLGAVLAKLGHRREAAAVEIAMWDLMGKAVGLPVYRLLGAERPLAAVPHSLYAFLRAPGRDGSGQVTPGNYVEHWTGEMRRHGFGTIKCKLGSREPMEEVEYVEALRAAVWAGGKDTGGSERCVVSGDGTTSAAPAGPRRPGVRRGAGALQPAGGHRYGGPATSARRGTHANLCRWLFGSYEATAGGVAPSGRRGDV